MNAQLQLLDTPPMPGTNAIRPCARTIGRVDGAEGGGGSKSALNLSPANASRNLEVWKNFLRNFGDDFRDNWEEYERQYNTRIAERRKQWKLKGGDDHSFERELGRIDLYYLAKRILPYNRMTFRLHYRVVRFLELPLPHKFLLLPRGYFKSSIMHAKRIKTIINFPNAAIFVPTGTPDLVRGLCSEEKALFEHCDALHELYPEICPKVGEEFGTVESYISPSRTEHWRKEPTVRFATTGQKQTGNHYDQHHPDDLVNKENAKSPDLLAAVKNWHADLRYLGPMTVSPELPYEETATGTPYTHKSLYAEFEMDRLEDGGKWAILKLPAIEETVENGLPVRRALCPELQTLEDLDLERGNTPEERDTFAAQKMLNPTSESATVKREHIVYRYEDHTAEELQGCILNLHLDAAASESKRADYSAFVVTAATPDGKLDVVEYIEARMQEQEFINTLFRLWDKYKPFGRFQNITIQGAVIELIFRSAIEAEEKRRNEYLPFFAVTVHRRDKTLRIRRLLPRVQRQEVRIRPFMVSLENQLLEQSAHDDILDALSDVEDVIEFPKAEVPPEPVKEYTGTTFNEAHKILSDVVWESARHENQRRQELEACGVAT